MTVQHAVTGHTNVLFDRNLCITFFLFVWVGGWFCLFVFNG